MPLQNLMEEDPIEEPAKSDSEEDARKCDAPTPGPSSIVIASRSTGRLHCVSPGDSRRCSRRVAGSNSTSTRCRSSSMPHGIGDLPHPRVLFAFRGFRPGIPKGRSREWAMSARCYRRPRWGWHPRRSHHAAGPSCGHRSCEAWRPARRALRASARRPRRPPRRAPCRGARPA